MIRKFFVFSILFLAAIGWGVAAAGDLTPKEDLGKHLFFDKNLSVNNNQSCATCHAQEAGWTGPDSNINAHGAVYEGSIPGAFGDGSRPARLCHAEPDPSPDTEGAFYRGNFWDGRATGETLGSPAAEQAKGPFLNP